LKQAQSEDLFRDLEMPLIPILAGMEMEGIGLDIPFLQEMSGKLEENLDELEIRIFTSVGHEFNLNSPKQLSEAIFAKLGLVPPDRGSKTASGYYSTSADVLEYLRNQHEVPSLLLEYREYTKLKSTYVDSLQTQVNPETGRVHTSYNQTGSVTGRIASTDPNLQNIPIRTELGRQVRKAFVAAPDHLLVAVDYSQIELRVAAHMAGDQAMLTAFREGKDIHTTTAAAIHNIPLDQVSSQQRRDAKAINFGLIYGMSAFGLTQTTDLTLAEAEQFVETYFRGNVLMATQPMEWKNPARAVKYILQPLESEQIYEYLISRKKIFPEDIKGSLSNFDQIVRFIR
jgi:DNA polymerase-1